MTVAAAGKIDARTLATGSARGAQSSSSGGQSADGRRLALKQHIDEIAAYLKAQALEVDLPRTYPQAEGSTAVSHYVLEEVPPFFGRVKCVLDQWYDSHLLSVYDEVVILVRPKGSNGTGTSAWSK